MRFGGDGGWATGLSSVLPQGIAWAVTDPGAEHVLDPAEEASLSRAVPARRREFAAGRAAARGAIRDLGLAPRAIPMGPDRAPIWPAEIVGSISHTKNHCVAAAGRARDFRSIGLDIEEDEPLPPELVPEICLPAEIDWLGTQPGTTARLIFSAKEAAYKCQYPLTGLLFGFDRLRILPDPAGAGFCAIFQADTGPFPRGTQWRGSWCIGAGLVIAAMALPRG